MQDLAMGFMNTGPDKSEALTGICGVLNTRARDGSVVLMTDRLVGDITNVCDLAVIQTVHICSRT